MSYQSNKQVDKVVDTILSYVRGGTTLHVSYAPSVIKESFGVESHIFIQAVDRLKHMIPVRVTDGGYYRKASKYHDWKADVYSFLSDGAEFLGIYYDGHSLGRNNSPKRKCEQWREHLKTA